MKTLYLDRSTSTGRNGAWVEELDLDGVDRIVVGMGPGSFAGIRSALAFAQGYALGKDCEVVGLPSPCAIAGEFYATETDNQQPTTDNQQPLAVVGDARREKYWVALFDGLKLICPVFQVDKADLHLRIPLSAKVVSPDAKRIDELLKETFAERYLGERLPTDEGLKAYAEANPAALVKEPLPIYLNPAVRD